MQEGLTTVEMILIGLDIVMVAALIATAILYRRANKIANQAKAEARESNEIAREALATSTEANRIAQKGLEITEATRVDNIRPVLSFDREPHGSSGFKNRGNGPARNIWMRATVPASIEDREDCENLATSINKKFGDGKRSLAQGAVELLSSNPGALCALELELRYEDDAGNPYHLKGQAETLEPVSSSDE